MGIGGMLRNHQNVQSVQSAVHGMYVDDKRPDIIVQLTNLYNRLLGLEGQFYSFIGKSKTQFQQDYINAQAQLAGTQSILYELENQFVERYSNKGAILDRDKTVQAFLDKVNQDIQSDPEMSKKLHDFSTSAIDLVLETLNAAGAKVSFSKSTSRKTSLGDKKVGLGRLQLKISQDRKGIVQKVHANNDLITDEYVKKMQNYIDGTAATGTFDKTVFVNEVVSELKSRGLGHLVYAARSAANNIDVNQSAAAIRGYFGELYALATLQQLFGNNKVMHTGSLRKSGSGQQIPIDLVVQQGMRQFNFQVKNYSIKNDKITLSNTISATNLIDNRLMLTGNVADILTEFFASYQYNQPFTGRLAEYYANTSMPVPVYESQVYSQFQSIFNDISYSFNQSALNLFKISDIFSVDSGGLFTKEAEYFNHFFIIQNRIVPASDIIQQIINGLTNDRPIVRFNLSKTSNSEDTLQAHFFEQYNPPLNSLAQQVDVRYSITITV